MEALRKKWNSCRGASILLGLLFLLVCTMAGASILAAASSSVGKIRSNKEEQQKYLTLSSALNLLIHELEKVEYVGKYGYVLNNNCVHLNKEDDPSSGKQHTKDHVYTQNAGTLRLRGDKSAWEMEDVLPLYEYLDFIFANKFTSEPENLGEGYVYDSWIEQRLFDPEAPPTRIFTLQLNADLGAAYGSLSDTVQVVVELKDSGRIFLTATLMEEKAGTLSPTKYIVTAVMESDSNKWPSQRLTLMESNDLSSGGAYETVSISWTLDVIRKGAAPDETAS